MKHYNIPLVCIPLIETLEWERDDMQNDND